MTQTYYDRLIGGGRADFAQRATEILEKGKLIGPDPKGFEGFYQYVYNDWILLYSPTANEIAHLAPGTVK